MLIRLGFDIDGTWASIGWWVHSPLLPTSDVPYLDAIINAVILGPLGHVLELMHSGATCTTCRVTTFGVSPVDISRSPAPNAGAWTGGQAAQVALGLHWITGEPGRRGAAITHVPAFPDAFTDDHASVNEVAIGNALARGTDILADFDAMPGAAGGTCTLGTLQRSAAGVPLGASRFIGFIAVVPTHRVCTIRRRISRNGRVSPS